MSERAIGLWTLPLLPRGQAAAHKAYRRTEPAFLMGLLIPLASTAFARLAQHTAVKTMKYRVIANRYTIYGGNDVKLSLVAVKEAPDIETRLNEIEKLLKIIIGLPCKYSRSEIVLTFFERSSIDQVLKDDHDHVVPTAYQTPARISEIMRSNGFCLANTETLVIDQEIAAATDTQPAADAADRLLQNGEEFTEDMDEDDPSAYVTNLLYYQLVPFETDILE
ncbi:PX domain-containing protein 1 [Rhinoraja longicauda]